MPSPYVTKKEFDELNNSVNRLVDLFEKNSGVTKPVADPKVEKEIEEAGPNKYSTDDEWDAIAMEIIGEAVDHTEVERKGGGVKFTVVIKKELSNAAPEYLERMKVDRRTREVGADGTEGVTQYCKLIKANLARPR